MKNLTLLIILTIQVSLAAQEIIPIPVDTTSVWRVKRQHNDETCVYHYNSIYYIDGTVVRWGKVYYKIYEEGEHWMTPVNPQYPCSGGYDYTGVFRGAIRTENGKTYGYTGWGETPYLLMDFTLNVGDTLMSDIGYGLIINSIDSVLVGDQYRKRLNMLNSWWEEVWMVEGVGHKKGLFESMDPFEGDSYIKCYGENGIPIFGNLGCDITVGYEEILSMNEKIKIYPNPTLNNVTINTSEIKSEIRSIILIDTFGKLIFNQQHESLNKDQVEINLSNCPPGIYLLIINLSGNKRVLEKIMKK